MAGEPVSVYDGRAAARQKKSDRLVSSPKFPIRSHCNRYAHRHGLSLHLAYEETDEKKLAAAAQRGSSSVNLLRILSAR